MKLELQRKEEALQALRKRTDEYQGEIDSMVAKSKSDTQLASLVREALEAKLQALTEAKEKEKGALQDEILSLQRQYVFPNE